MTKKFQSGSGMNAALRSVGFSQMPFGNSVEHAVLVVPKGHRENSPAFQRWVGFSQTKQVPKGRLNAEWLTEIAGTCTGQPSLRDSILVRIDPSVETLGYCHHVPPGRTSE